jgi:hypothetical protein
MANARLPLTLCLLLAACGDDGSNQDDETQERDPSTAGDGDITSNTPDASSGARDAGSAPRDASTTPISDAGTIRDASTAPVADAGPADAGPQRDASIAPAAPTFREVYALIANNCSPCHTSEADGDLDMSTRVIAYGNLVDQDAEGSACRGSGRVRVVPGDAQESLLVQKLEGTQDCGSRMPRNRTPLPAASIDLIKGWIEAGASNN